MSCGAKNRGAHLSHLSQSTSDTAHLTIILDSSTITLANDRRGANYGAKTPMTQPQLTCLAMNITCCNALQLFTQGNCSQRACAAMSSQATTSSSTDGALPYPPASPVHSPLPTWGRKARSTHRLRMPVPPDAVGRWSFLFTDAAARTEDGKPAVNGVRHERPPAVMMTDADVEPPVKRLAQSADAVQAAAAAVMTPDVKRWHGAAQDTPTSVDTASQGRAEMAHHVHCPVKTEDVAAVSTPASPGSGPAAGTMQHLLQYLMHAQLLEHRANAWQGGVGGSPHATPPQKQTCHDEAAAEHASMATAAGAVAAVQPPAPPDAEAPDAPGNGEIVVSDSIAAILQAVRQQAAAQSGGRCASNPPSSAVAGTSAAVPSAAAAADVRKGSGDVATACVAPQGDWQQDVRSILQQLAAGQARGHDVALPPALSTPQTQPMTPAAALGQSALGSTSYSPSQMTAFSRQHDVNQEKNKRIQEEANMLVRSGLINRPSSAAVQAPPPPQHRQQPAPQQSQPRGMQLSSQSVLAHYNLHQQQQLAQQLQQRQQEQVAVIAQQLLHQQMQQRGHVPAGPTEVHQQHPSHAPAQLSESEIQFLHAAHANGTLRSMQLQHAQQSSQHASHHQAQPQAHVPTSPQQQRHAARPQHHSPELHSMLLALQGVPEPSPASQAMQRRSALGADVRASNTERIESLRRQVSSHLRASGTADAPTSPGAAPDTVSHQQDHRSALAEQLIREIAASMAHGGPGHLAGLLQQHTASAMVLEPNFRTDRVGVHGAQMFQAGQGGPTRSAEAGHAAGGAPSVIGMPQQSQRMMSRGMGPADQQSSPTSTPMQPMPPPASLSSVAGSGAAIPFLSSLMTGFAHPEAKTGAFTAPPQVGPGQRAVGLDAASLAPAVAGMHEGGEHESETENRRAKENPPLGAGGRWDMRDCGAEHVRSALTVTRNGTGDGQRAAAGLGKQGGVNGNGESPDQDRDAEADAGKSSSDGRVANENVQLLCKDRGAGADAQDNLLLDPAVS